MTTETKEPGSPPEPFGYFRATLDGWEDCAETDEGARPLYEYDEIAKRDARIAQLDAMLDHAKEEAAYTEEMLRREYTAPHAQLSEIKGEIMDKQFAIDLLKLLSALESWSFSVGKPLPDHTLEELDRLGVELEQEILK